MFFGYLLGVRLCYPDDIFQTSRYARSSGRNHGWRCCRTTGLSAFVLIAGKDVGDRNVLREPQTWVTVCLPSLITEFQHKDSIDYEP